MTSKQNFLAYKEALADTESIQPPALGFITPQEYNKVTTGTEAIIKQNNTQLSLLVSIASHLADLTEEVSQLKKEISTRSKGKGVQEEFHIPDDLITRLENLSLGKPAPPKEKKGTFYAFRDPHKLVQEELKKVREQK